MKHTAAGAESLADIAAALDRLCQELAVVREVLDEIRDELQWANRNRAVDSWSASQSPPLANVASNSVAADEADRLPRGSAVDLSAEANVGIVGPAKQLGRLF